jgi:transcriptional regulator with XRE-family HTH domain
MTAQPTPRGPLGHLIEARKTALGLEWEDVWRASGVRKTTLESWLNGRVREPPLRGVLRLRQALEIPFEDLEAAALQPDGETRPPTEDQATRVLREEPSVRRTSKRSARLSD